MIELQRAKLGLPPMATQPAAAATVAGQASTIAQVNTVQAQQLTAAQAPPQVAAAAAAAVAPPRLTPHQQAAAAVHAQEEQLQKFLHRLQQREDHHASTVPTALSRRMLQRQGVGYLDDNVASVVSATADRFLATVLQQAVACRDQRLKGIEMAREEARYRRHHIQQHQADADDRKRRKLARQDASQKANLEAIAAADRLKAAGLTPNATTAISSPASKSKKKKKKGENGDKSDDEMSYDSLEEEEEYYQSYYGRGENGENSDDEDEDENQDMLVLRDLERPLEAWDVHLTGKVGLGMVAGDSSDEASDEENMDAEMNGVSEPKGQQLDNDGDQQSPAAKTTAGSPASKGGTNSASGRAKSPAPVTKKAESKASSPVPNKA